MKWSIRYVAVFHCIELRNFLLASLQVFTVKITILFMSKKLKHSAKYKPQHEGE